MVSASLTVLSAMESSWSVVMWVPTIMVRTASTSSHCDIDSELGYSGIGISNLKWNGEDEVNVNV